MRCTKNEPRESSSTSGSGLRTSSSAGRSEDAVVLLLAGFLTTLVFGRTGLTGLSCSFAGLSCDGFLFQNGSSPCQKNNHTFREYLDRSKFRYKGLYDSYSWWFIEGAAARSSPYNPAQRPRSYLRRFTEQSGLKTPLRGLRAFY